MFYPHTLRLFDCKKTKQFTKQAELLFKKRFGKHFKLNAFKIIFGMQYKGGNNASKLGIFLWSKLIKTIWISRKLLEDTKPCNEMAILIFLIKNRLQNEYKATIEQPEGKEKFHKLLVLRRYPCYMHGYLQANCKYLMW